MDLSSNLVGTDVLVALLVFGIVAAVAALGVIAHFVVTNRRERVARNESFRTYYGRLSLTA